MSQGNSDLGIAEKPDVQKNPNKRKTQKTQTVRKTALRAAAVSHTQTCPGQKVLDLKMAFNSLCLDTECLLSEKL